MSTASAAMLPPMHHHMNGNRFKGENGGSYGGDAGLNGGSPSDSSGTPPVANLTEESMMVMSQSIDSIHTMGTAGGSESLDDRVRTLFVSGLPLDTKSRELYLLFRGFKGYLSSTLKPAGKNGKLTAPVGFVTFETREQAENALSELQGVKFDPEGNQHMRLEFARSNTKVTKPKWPPGVPMSPGAAGFPFIPGTAGAAIGQQAAFPGMVAGNIFPQLAGFDPATMALIAAHDPNQWANFGYDNTGLFTSLAAAQGLAPATLLQAANFRPIIQVSAAPGTPGSQTAATSATNHFQLVQAALQASNAATALGLMATGNNTPQQHSANQSTARTPQGPSPTGTANSSGSASAINQSQAAYTTMQQNHQQHHYMATTTAAQQRQQAAVAAAVAGLPTGISLIPGMLTGFSTAVGDEHQLQAAVASATNSVPLSY